MMPLQLGITQPGMTKLYSPEICFGGSFFWIKEEFNGKVGFSSFTDLLAYEDGILTTFPKLALSEPFRVPRAVGNTFPIFPSFNAVLPFHYNDFHFAIGLAIDAPWGLETDYSYSHVRTYAEQTLVESLQFNPSVAFGYQGLTFAVGYGRELLETKITTSMINSGAYFRLRGWDNTYNLAFMYQVDPTLCVGATYRPGMTHHIKGSANILFSAGDATCRFKTPAVLTVGFKYEVNSCWSLLGTIGYNLWSQVKKIEIFTGIDQVSVVPASLAVLESFIPAFFPIPPGATVKVNNPITLRTGVATVMIDGKDAVFLALGSKYVASDMWTLKMGFAYDQSPLRSGTRELRIPDNDHYLLSVGARCNFNEFVFADFGLEYIYTPKCGIHNNPVLPVPAVPATLTVTEGAFSETVPISQFITVPQSQQGFNGPINTTAMAIAIQVGIIFP